MSAPVIEPVAPGLLSEDWQARLRSACEAIAPAWPLDQWIAVNPFWGLKHLPAQAVDRTLIQRGGHSILMPPGFYREAWQGGRIRRQDLESALSEQGSAEAPQVLIDWLANADEVGIRPCNGSAVMTYPALPEGESVLDAVRHQIGESCASFFDERQAGWSAGREDGCLFRFWLSSASDNPLLDAATGIRGARKALRAVPDETDAALHQAVATLNTGGETLEALSHFWLLQVNGWASWCRGEDWRAGLEGRRSDRVRELLAIALVWEMVAVSCASVNQRVDYLKHRVGFTRLPPVSRSNRLWTWHRAYEVGYQRTLWQSLARSGAGKEADVTTSVQAAFCIDVRSEVLRRHLEAAMPGVQTIGFAGFFGLPIEHHRHGPLRPVRRLPGLLPSRYRLVDTCGSPGDDRHRHRQLDQQEIGRGSVRKAKYSSLSTFTLVETTGLAWAWKLLRDSLKRPHRQHTNQPWEGRLVHATGGDPLTDEEKAQVLAGALRGMSLTGDFAPLVAFVGHGSHADNNPNQAGLACGACGGQGGAVNARLAARLFNDPQVRAALVEQGIRIPDYCWAIAGDHCTLTDQVTLMDVDQVPDSHLRYLDELSRAFEQAGLEARRERAAALGLNGLDDTALLAAMEGRGHDWSEVRPEWGLANNAAIVFARRERTRGVDLGGRVFLHDYDAGLDDDGGILEALMTAPMVVANWINLQYFASVTAPQLHGAGNKLLHSVVGGNIGVVEGNNPQLRVGLPLQSVHDGSLWRHEPLRLTVLIDAPAERIEGILSRQRDVADLVDNQWLFLCRLTEQGIEQYQHGHWQSV